MMMTLTCWPGGKIVGRIYKAAAAPVGSPWMWTLAFGHHEDRTPTHGYEATREAAMAAFAKFGGGNRPALALARPLARSLGEHTMKNWHPNWHRTVQHRTGLGSTTAHCA
jgi:hypothetical protein